MAEKGFRASSIYVNLVAQTSKFEKGMQRSRTQLGMLQKEVRNVGVALAGAFSIRYAGSALLESMRGIDSLAKTSRKLGVATENLAGLRFAAEQTGVAISKLDMGLQRMVRRISEASIGKGEAIGALAELGLNPRLLNQMAPDAQFREIARAMEAVGNQADRVRLSFKLFDSEGVALVNTLAAGAEQLDRFKQEAIDAGYAVKEQDALGVEKALDALNRMSKSWEGFKRSVATFAAPTLASLFDSMAEFLREARRTPGYWAQSVNAVMGEVGRPEYREIRRQFDREAGVAVNVERNVRTAPHAPRPPRRLGSRGEISPALPLSEFDQGYRIALAAGLRGVLGTLRDRALRTIGGYRGMAHVLGQQANRFYQTGGIGASLRRTFLGPGGTNEAQPVRSLAALEVGSRAAFSQRVRTSQQRSVEEVQKKQLKEQSETRKAVQGILDQVRSGVALGFANLQGAF